jgi:triacylglycerol lipase
VNRLLNHITLDADDPIWDFLKTMKIDQGAIIQLTPEALHLFNAAVTDRSGIAYSCVMSAVPTPNLKTLRTESVSPTAALSMLLFSFLHTIARREHPSYPYPELPGDIFQTLRTALDMPITPSCNDGISPLVSQHYGKLIHAVRADHLDIVGQFDGAGGELFTDWLVSGAQFGEKEFQTVWAKIGDEIAAAMLA